MSVSNLNIARCQNQEPILEEPPSPCPEYVERDIEDFPGPLAVVRDIEDFGCEYDDEMPMVRLNTDRFRENLGSFIRSNGISLQGREISNAMIQGGEMLGALPLTLVDEETAKIPLPKLKNMFRLRTVHRV